jgi:hypothetical protein
MTRCGVPAASNDAPDGATDEAGAPDEIEITPVMIEAGVARLFDYDPQFSNERDIVREIFTSMLRESAPLRHLLPRAHRQGAS